MPEILSPRGLGEELKAELRFLKEIEPRIKEIEKNIKRLDLESVRLEKDIIKASKETVDLEKGIANVHKEIAAAVSDFTKAQNITMRWAIGIIAIPVIAFSSFLIKELLK